ncbi:MAG TPA: hypothetical protein VFW85_03035 [Gaiellaceae bacterium]|nr:hypothetical protein [Gaiellaceae bacterium]
MSRARRYVIVVAVVAAATAAAATAFGQTVTIGQPVGGATCALAGVFFQTSVASTSASFVVPAGQWTLTSWSTDSNGAGSMGLVVVRANGGGTYKVVGTSPVEDLSALGAGVKTFSTSISVQGGDLLGFWGQFGTNCGFSTGNAGDEFGLLGGSHPSTGTVFTPSVLSTATMDISATLTRGSGSSPGNSSRGGYCSVAGDTWADGSAIPAGTFLNLDIGQASSDARFKGATPAAYFQGAGITCDNPPTGYMDTGTKVNSGGVVSVDGLYEYWSKS